MNIDEAKNRLNKYPLIDNALSFDEACQTGIRALEGVCNIKDRINKELNNNSCATQLPGRAIGLLRALDIVDEVIKEIEG